MKTYLKIIGILNGLILLVVVALLTYISVDKNGDERIVSLLLFIPAYFFLHYFIATRFGFSEKNNLKMPKWLFIFSIITLIIFAINPMISGFDRIKDIKEKNNLEKLVDWGSDTTAFNYVADLKTKYIDGEMQYRLNITTDSVFN